MTYAELDAAADRLARALMTAGLEVGDRVGIWAPNCAEWALTQFATAKAGIILVNINPAYRPTELSYALKQSGCRLLDQRAVVQDVGLRRDGRRGPRRPPGARARRLPRLARLGRAARRRRRHGPRGAAQPLLGPAVRRRDQHPVHERHDRLPQGRDAQPPQHPQQRVLRRRAVRLHEGRPRLHPRPALPLLRHGHGQPRLRRPRRDDGLPLRRLRSGRDARGRPGGTLHVALRRADDVHRRARASRVRVLRPRRACAPGSWPGRRARSRSCAASSTRCTWAR